MKKLSMLFVSLLLLITIITPIMAEEVANVRTVDELLESINSNTISSIILESDISFDENLDIETPDYILDLSNKVLDLNGFTLSSYHFDVLFDGENFTIKKGIIDSLNRSDYPLFIGERPTSNVLIENVEIKGGINVYNAQNVILRNCNSHANSYYAIWADEGANIVVEGGKYVTTDKTKSALLGITNRKDSSITVNGGTFIVNDNKDLVLKDFKEPVFNGGSYNKNPISYISEDKSLARVDDMYYIGSDQELQEIINEAESEIEILKGLRNIITPDGVKVTNSSDGEIIVNGETLIKDDNIIADAMPIVEVSYSNDGNWTNEDVIVTIKVSEKIKKLDGWYQEDDQTFTKVYTNNGKEVLTIEDMTANKVEITVNVQKIDKNAPEIKGLSDITLTKGTTFDPLEGVIGYDEEMGIIDSSNISVEMMTRTLFDTSKVGTYNLLYSLSDLAANVTTAKRTVRVVEKPTISCAGSKDKNCDGVVTCDEEKGLGWIWNNDKGVCEFKGNSNIYIVNTSVK